MNHSFPINENTSSDILFEISLELILNVNFLQNQNNDNIFLKKNKANLIKLAYFFLLASEAKNTFDKFLFIEKAKSLITLNYLNEEIYKMIENKLKKII